MANPENYFYNKVAYYDSTIDYYVGQAPYYPEKKKYVYEHFRGSGQKDIVLSSYANISIEEENFFVFTIPDFVEGQHTGMFTLVRRDNDSELHGNWQYEVLTDETNRFRIVRHRFVFPYGATVMVKYVPIVPIATEDFHTDLPRGDPQSTI